MKKSEINFQIELDESNLPKAIRWDASDKEGEGAESTKSISLNVYLDLIQICWPGITMILFGCM